MNNESDKKDWARVLSPAVFVIAFSIIIIAGSLLVLWRSEGWSMLNVIVWTPVCIGLLILDLIIKMMVKKKAWVIWIVELTAIVLAYVFWISEYGILI